MNPFLAKVERLDTRREEDVRRYEEGFYRAFFSRSNPGIRSIWQWDDDSKRLRTRVPYEDQEIFFLRGEDGRIHTAGAVNRAVRQFQSGAYGFPRPAQEPKWLEVLAAFNGAPGLGTTALLAVFEGAFQALSPEGYAFVYATCPEYSRKWNERLGWEVTGKSQANSVVRYFLRMDIRPPFRVGGKGPCDKRRQEVQDGSLGGDGTVATV